MEVILDVISTEWSHKRKDGNTVKKLLLLAVMALFLVGGMIGCKGDEGTKPKATPAPTK
jgi:hypothetical protein